MCEIKDPSLISEENQCIKGLIKNLKKDTKIVASARFNKVRRLQNQSNFSLLSISLLSFILIIISIVEQKLGIKDICIPFIGVIIPMWYFSIISSIFILVISVYITKNQYEIHISRLYASAVKINKIYRELEKIEQCSLYDVSLCEKYSKILDDYNNVLDEDHINHDTIDYIVAKKSDGEWLYNCKIRVLHFITNTTTYYWLIIIVSIAVLLSITLQVL